MLTTPIIRSIRAAYPDARIAYLGDKEGVTLLEGNPFLNEIIPYDYSRPAWREQLRVASALRRGKFDLAIDLFNNPRSALVIWLSGAKTRVGLERKGRGSLYTIQVRDDGRTKTPVEFHNQLLRAAGIMPAAARTEIFLSREERAAAGQHLPPGDGPLVGIHPGASWPAKRWFPERFAQLADRLMDAGMRVLVTCGPKDTEAVAHMLALMEHDLHVVPSLPVRATAAVISRCDAFVSNDAGPMHIAPALNVPTIGLFGPGEENIWFPYDPAAGHRALRRDVPCHPCHLDFCNQIGNDYMRCMDLLSVEAVVEAVRGAIRHRPE